MKSALSACLIVLLALPLTAQFVPDDMEAPSYDKLVWMDGADVTLIQGKPAVFEFWSTTCGSCIKSMKHIAGLAEKFKGKVSFVSVAVEKDKDRVATFMKKREIGTAVAVDLDQSFREGFKGTFIPHTAIVDADRNIRWIGRPGQLTGEILTAFIEDGEIPEPAEKKEFLKITVMESEDQFGESSMSVGTSPDRMYYACKYRSLMNVIDALSDYTLPGATEEDFIVEGPEPLEPYVDLEAEMNGDLTFPEFSRAVLKVLEATFNFSYRLDYQNREVTTMKLTRHDLLAKAQVSADRYENMEYEETDSEIILRKAYADNLLMYLERQFDRKFKWYGSPSGRFDFSFPKASLKKAIVHLTMKYGLQFEDDILAVPVHIITFPEAEKPSGEEVEMKASL
ncbi:MAG: hypothetical protein CL946_13185 [Ectothiorhodospiraceae bacterium]|nr:hypothetical protein [Ectothiorhodospiraceae bacterium]